MNKPTQFTLLVLGGTSAIALAYTRQRLDSLAKDSRNIHVILAGRNAEKLEAEKKDLISRGAKVTKVVADLSDLKAIKKTLKGHDVIDEAILAYGMLTDQDLAQTDLEYLQQSLTVNFTSAALWLEALSARFVTQDFGRVLIIGSVAGDRGRQSNYSYGSAKAGLETYVQGLQHRLAPQKSISVTLVKPGFVDSPMTAHIEPKGALWAKPEKVAQTMESALLKSKRVTYAPKFWRLIMSIIRSVPTFVFHKTKL